MTFFLVKVFVLPSPMALRSGLVRWENDARHLIAPLPVEPAPVKTPSPHLLVATTPQTGRRMARIKSKDTAPELLVRRYLHAAGFRFRLHDTGLPGTPDVVLPRYRTVVFVQGCFWHSHGAECLRKSREAPKTNAEFWQAKLAIN